jgi:hypothetical protein
MLGGLLHLRNRLIDSEEPDALFTCSGKCDRRGGVVLRIARGREDRYDPKQKQDFEPTLHAVQTRCNSLAKVPPL